MPLRRPGGQHDEIPAEIILLEALPDKSTPVLRFVGLVQRSDPVGEKQTAAGRRPRAEGQQPDGQAKARDAARGAAGATGHDDGHRRHPLERGLDTHGDQVAKLDDLVSSSLQDLADLGGRSQRFNGRGNPGKHRHGFDRVLSHGGFAGQHDAVRAVEDRVGHVRCLGPRRAAVRRHRLEHLGGRDHGAPEEIGAAYEILLHGGDPFDGDFHPEVAARDHDAVGGREDLVDVIQGRRPLDLGDDERIVPQGSRPFANGVDVGGIFDERLADRVDALPKRELQAFAVLPGKRADAEVDAGDVQAFARSEFPPDLDLAGYVPALCREDFELDHSVVDEDLVAAPYHPGQGFERHRDAPRIAGDVVGRQDERFARLQFDVLFSDLPDPHLRTRQIRHDRHGTADASGGLAHEADHRSVAFEVAVRKVQPCNRHPRADHALQRLRRSRRGPDGCDDLRLVSGKRHASPPPVSPCGASSGRRAGGARLGPSYLFLRPWSKATTVTSTAALMIIWYPVSTLHW